jgi:hypothetical protein
MLPKIIESISISSNRSPIDTTQVLVDNARYPPQSEADNSPRKINR